MQSTDVVTYRSTILTHSRVGTCAVWVQLEGENRNIAGKASGTL